MAKDSLTITDNRTGQSYELPIQEGTIKAIDLRKIKTGPEDFGLMTYDPAFTNTASCQSQITFIDGDKGILNYRGYPIEELAEKSTFLETAYLILNGELPRKDQHDHWVYNITHHTMVHENIKGLLDGFRYDAHPMGMLMSTVAALSTFYPEAKDVRNKEIRRDEIFRLIAKVPTLAAFSYRHLMGLPYAYPNNDLSYCGNFLQMMFKMAGSYQVNPGPGARAGGAVHPARRPRAELLDLGHARGGLVRGRSLLVDGRRHRGALRAAARRRQRDGPAHAQEIGSKDRIPAFIQEVKTSGGEVRLMGFGHRVYKNYDPRAKIIKRMADQVFEVTGRNPLLDIALELERIALEDEYFVKRKLYPNVDFYSGLIYQAMGFPVDMFPVLFAIPRTAGWLAQWEEMLEDKDQKIARPRQIYRGSARREFTPLSSRG